MRVGFWRFLEALYDHILAHESVVMWTGEQILDWYRLQTAGTAPAR